MSQKYDELIKNIIPSRDGIIGNNLIKAHNYINSPLYKKILVAVSGGSDSDLVVDIVEKVRDSDNQIDYVFFDTGIEYQATKEHLDYLEKRYGISIERYRAKNPVPLSVRKNGQPFINKLPVSEYIGRLMKFGFEWEDLPYEELVKKYCKTPTPEQREKFENERLINGALSVGRGKGGYVYIDGDWYSGCISALKWWCNLHTDKRDNINNNKYLKEFLINNHPDFKIGHTCCNYAKIKPATDLTREREYNLTILGTRLSEGGARVRSHTGCFSNGKYPQYRPIWWYTDDIKKEYEEGYNIIHSRCYTEYGLNRTGCVGCPFGRNYLKEVQAAEKYEPGLAKVCKNIFADSYVYTDKYRDFCKKEKIKNEEK